MDQQPVTGLDRNHALPADLLWRHRLPKGHRKSSQYPVDAFDVKSLRIEISSGPFERPLVLRMIFVADLFKKICVAHYTTAILRRAGSLTGDKFRIGLFLNRRQ